MDFDAAAAAWDENPMRHDRARTVARALVEDLSPAPGSTALEFGCGTGLLSFCLSDRFAKIVLVDPSEGMIRVLREKVEAAGLGHFDPRVGTLDPSLPPADCVYSLMVLHHIRDLEGTFAAFFRALNPGGGLAVADLALEDGSFHRHEPDFDGHNGFDPEALARLAEAAGFTACRHRTVYEVRKAVGGTDRVYPVFLLTCRKA